jgi:hypothetical protein
MSPLWGTFSRIHASEARGRRRRRTAIAAAAVSISPCKAAVETSQVYPAVYSGYLSTNRRAQARLSA